MKLVEIIKYSLSNLNTYPQKAKKKSLIFQFGDILFFQAQPVSVESECGWAPRAWHEFVF